MNKKDVFITGKVRFAFPNLFEPRAAVEGAPKRYSITILIPKSDEKEVERFMQAIEKAKEQFKAVWGGKIPPTLRLPLRDGDVDRPDRPEFAGHYFVNATSKFQPLVVDKDLQPIIDPSEIYGGCYGRVSLRFYGYNVAGNRGIGVGLNNVQKLEDGEPFAGTRDASEFNMV